MSTLEGPQCIVDKSSKNILARGRVPPPISGNAGIWSPHPYLINHLAGTKE